jgi:hypothetical protein
MRGSPPAAGRKGQKKFFHEVELKQLQFIFLGLSSKLDLVLNP